MASFISDWYTGMQRLQMRKVGIHFCPTQRPSCLYILPCRFMVLTAILQLASAEAMSGMCLNLFTDFQPTTWVDAFGGVRNLHHPYCPVPLRHRVPPDPVFIPPMDGEGKGPLDATTQDPTPIINQLSEEELAAFMDFDVKSTDPWHRWDDLPLHVQDPACFVACSESFGPIGLLSDAPEVQAYVDSCASLTVTPHRGDFIEYKPMGGKVLQGLVAGANIAGIGIIHWQVEASGKIVDLKIRALHVPDSADRLLCPQQLQQQLNMKRNSEIADKRLIIHFDEGDCECPYNEANLPVIMITSPTAIKAQLSALNVCVTQEANQNLSPPQKELLKWHYKLGHLGLQRVQALIRTGALGSHPLVRAAGTCERPMCSSCAYGKAKRRPTRSKTTKVVTTKALSKETMIPGEKVSMDHFIVTTPGRLWETRGSESHDRRYKGGVIFTDHASGYIYHVPVINFTAGEALRAKREFEQHMNTMGVTILNYHSDNGVFTAREFQDEISRMEQNLTLSGVGAHHQNAMAERAIGTLTAMTRTAMLHARLRWTKVITPELWPMAMKHAEHILNHTPRENNVCPLDLITRSTVPRSVLRELHVWGCPVYVLDPKLQDGKKIPKFDPRSRRGLNVGLSPRHAATVPSVLNLQTGNISPQFHVVFDDWFSTVAATGDDELELDSKLWEDLLVDDRFLLSEFDDDDPVQLGDEWLTEQERLDRHQKATARVQEHMADPNLDPITVPTTPTHRRDASTIFEQQEPSPVTPRRSSLAPSTPPSNQREPPSNQREPPPPSPARDASRPKRERKQVERLNIKSMRTKSYKAKAKSIHKYMALFCSLIATSDVQVLAAEVVNSGSEAVYHAYKAYDTVTSTFDDHLDYTAYQAATSARFKKKGQDPDFPTYNQAMATPEVDQWREAMDKEIKTLIEMGTWTMVTRESVTQAGRRVIPTTWAFRLKRKPDGTAYKFKARWCVRGDLQVYGEDYWQSYSPVCQWSTVRLLLIMSTVHGLHTRQVDYVNAFAQADLDKEVYVELPKGYGHNNEVDCVLRLNKSLYGMVDAPMHFFNLLKTNLQLCGFKQKSYIDPCLFVAKKAICVSYVDDCLWVSYDEKAMDGIINQMKKKMDLTVESNDISAFLGIQFTRHDGVIEMKQLGLIDKIMKTTGMEDCNPISTPADPKTLGKDVNGKPFEESWSYAQVVGMLLYVSSNSRPDICFAVHQAARFTHDPKHSHAVAVKRIIRYLKGTRDRGLTFRPHSGFQVDCWVDADFCGLWGSEHPEDPTVAKSRSGYVITVAGCPLMWVSKLQTEVSVSTMMAEYVALSQAMRDMLPLKRLVKEIARVVTGNDEVDVVLKSDVWEDNNGALTVATMPRITPQSKFFAVKYHFFREHVKTEDNPNGEVHIQKIDTKRQLGDIMTKGLTEALFVPLRDRLMGWVDDMDEHAFIESQSGSVDASGTNSGSSSRGSVTKQASTTERKQGVD